MSSTSPNPGPSSKLKWEDLFEGVPPEAKAMVVKRLDEIQERISRYALRYVLRIVLSGLTTLVAAAGVVCFVTWSGMRTDIENSSVAKLTTDKAISDAIVTKASAALPDIDALKSKIDVLNRTATELQAKAESARGDLDSAATVVSIGLDRDVKQMQAMIEQIKAELLRPATPKRAP
jgi:hypothetical protein